MRKNPHTIASEIFSLWRYGFGEVNATECCAIFGFGVAGSASQDVDADEATRVRIYFHMPNDPRRIRMTTIDFQSLEGAPDLIVGIGKSDYSKVVAWQHERMVHIG